MSTAPPELTPESPSQTTSQSADAAGLACIECAAALDAKVTLVGEILDCPDCGLELEVRSVSPIVLAAAPEVEEDWGE